MGVHRRKVLKEIERNQDFKVDAGASRLADGNSEYALDFEQWLAKFHKAESALLFNSGYEANVAIFSILPRPKDIIVYDSAIHASVHVGMRNSRALFSQSFDHNDCDSLRKVLLQIIENDSAVGKG